MSAEAEFSKSVALGAEGVTIRVQAVAEGEDRTAVNRLAFG